MPGHIPTPTRSESRFLAALREEGFAGTITDAASDRVTMATDNSIYQVTPSAVVFPKDEADLAVIMRLLDQSEFHDVTIRPRGGGTGTNGQSLGGGIVVDCSRHMTRIIEIDAAGRRVRVQPGVIKDQLNDALRPHGLFFAPELSTSSRATIGGMISTDACGQGSCAYGKTSAHILSLRAALVGGEILSTRRAPLDAQDAHSDRATEALRVLDTISRDEAELIEARFPRLNRSLTGYDLAHIREGDSIDAAAVLCGSEGTLALISEATLNLLPIPNATVLLLIFYPDFQAALRDAREMAELGATSVETIDSRVLNLAREEASFDQVAHLFPEDGAEGVNIVEFTGDDEGALVAQSRLRQEELAGPGRLVVTLATGDDVPRVWTLRKAAVGLLGRARGTCRPIPFVEDCAVPPERLEPFIGAFRAVLDREGLEYGMFGHVDAGVLHVRPALDLTDPAQEPRIRRISDEVAALARAHGGLLWGEHGKGVRSEYVPEVFGPLYPALQRIKAAFDPRGQLNPGKIAAPDDGALWKIDAVPMRGQMDRQVPDALRTAYSSAFACNGNGACFNRDVGDVMCPSYKVTGDRRHSPKGRASLMREWLRQGGVDGKADAAFEAEVKEAMEGCLSCAACATQCPIRVDVPQLRAGFLESYHSRHLRPLRHHVLYWLETLLPLAARVPRMANIITRGPGAALLRRGGLAALPALPVDRPALDLLRDDELDTVDPTRDVVLVPDAFTAWFEPNIVEDLAVVLARAGKRLRVAPYRPSGKARQVLGHRRGAEAQMRWQAALLERIAATGAPMVQIEPAISASLRAELPSSAVRPMAPQELLAQLANRIPAIRRPLDVRLLPHCSERVRGATDIAAWRAVFERFGVTLDTPRAGCCGMAGMWGHETRNRAASEAIFAQSWEDAVASGPDVILATGYSCRCQTAEIAGRRLRHPISLLRELTDG